MEWFGTSFCGIAKAAMKDIVGVESIHARYDHG
jgi:hypothetical protein